MFCVGYGIYTINNAKHCITFLALSQPFPVLLTSRFHMVKYTHVAEFYKEFVISCLAMDAFTWDKLILLAAFFS